MQPTRSDHLSDAELALRGFSRETDLVLDREGCFHAGGAPIAHPGLAAAFARWLERTDAGRYVLRNDLHYVYLDVQGAPLHARGLELEDRRAWLLLDGGAREPLRIETLRQGPDGALFADARDGTWAVRLAPAAVLELAPLLEDGPDASLAGAIAISLGGARRVIPTVADPLRPGGGA